MSQYMQEWYQWNYRPQLVRRPVWFEAWPEGARIAVTIKLLHEWASVPRPTGRQASSSGSLVQQDYKSLSGREYGFKAGVERLMDVLDLHGVKATVMVSGLSAELWPASVRSIKARGHEIATHQWDQAVHPPRYKSREEEREFLIKSMAAIEKAIGERPFGYMSQGPSPTINTLEVIADEDFIWTGDYQDADVPYVINVGRKKIVSVGYVRPSFTDNDIMPLGLAGGFEQLKSEFDATYERFCETSNEICLCHSHPWREHARHGQASRQIFCSMRGATRAYGSVVASTWPTFG